MWPFKHKETTRQVEIKSITLPETTPKWQLGKLGGRIDWNVETAIKEGYNSSVVVNTCIEKRAKLVSCVPWVAYTKNTEGTFEKVPDSPLQKLIDKPNPDQSFSDIIYRAIQQLDLSGDAFISEIKAGVAELPVELWLLPSKNVTPQRGSNRLVDSYEYMEGNTRSAIKAEDMIQLTFPNPDDPVNGQPTLKAAGIAADIDREAATFQKVSYQNRGLSDINVKLPENTTSEQADYVSKKLKEKQGAKNARDPIVSTADVTVLNQTAAEMDFINSRRAVWSEICAQFGLSLSVLGMTEDVNLANGKEQQRALWVNTVIPLLDLISQQLDRQLVSEFNTDGVTYYLRYDLSNVVAMQDDINEKLDAAKKLFDMGFSTKVINNRLELGFEENEVDDVSYLPMGYIPAEFAGDEVSNNDDTNEDDKAANLGYGK